MASYNNNEDSPHEPDGVALVWNLKYKKETPEYIFHCQVRKVFTWNFATNYRLKIIISRRIHITNLIVLGLKASYYTIFRNIL